MWPYLGVYNIADNITYGTGEDMSNNGKAPVLEAGTYEVPMNSTASAVTQATMKTEPQYYELTESTHAIPNMYEYATLGANDEKVILTGCAVVGQILFA